MHINNVLIENFSCRLKNIITYLREFHANSGTWVFAATALNKTVMFLIKVFVLVYVEKEIYGQLTYANTIIMFIIPFVGFGSPIGLLRFGSITSNKNEQKRIENYTFSMGIINTILLILMVLPFFNLLSKGDNTVFFFLCILLIRVISLFLYSHQTSKLRVEFNNKEFGQYDMINSLLLFALGFLMTYYFHSTGYLLALGLAPLFAYIGYGMIKGFPSWQFNFNFDFKKKDFWSYSLFSSFSTIVSQMVFLVDIFLIGNILNNEAVAEYNAAGLIPLNILMLPVIFMQTDFAKIAHNYKNKRYLKSYYKKYLSLFVPLSVIILFLGFFFGEQMFSLLGKDYHPYNLFMYLLFAVSISILFRVPLGNMISAFGKARFNTISAIITLVVAIVLNLIFIDKYGLTGAAWATCISLILSSILNLAYFIWYIKYECE
ncbi:MAG: polysaccharide biosynthesis C-terminal domain-containing protein [Saprospiraceae bacterium]